MFGCLVAGRVLQTNLQQVDETHALFELTNASTINHICVFLLGTLPFPDGYGATVHFHWPGKGFQLLGMLSNEKPSAIFRLRGAYTPTTSSSKAHVAFSGSSLVAQNNADVTAILGIAIEPLNQIASALPSNSSVVNVSASSAGTVNPTAVAERVVRHLFNYISSFVGGGMNVAQDTMIPMGIIVKWYESFMNKIRMGGIGFLEREE